VFVDGSRETRLSDAGLAMQHHDVPTSRACLLPHAGELHHEVGSSEHRHWGIIRTARLKPRDDRCFAEDEPCLHWIESLHSDPSKRAIVEESPAAYARFVGNRDATGIRRLLLKPNGHVPRDAAWLLSTADLHNPRSNPNA